MSDEAQQAMLDATEARVLGSLIEKQATTPETYPLTLNALITACNQKTSREPVMNLEQGQVMRTVRALESRELVRCVMGARADRWEHKLDKALELTPPQLTVIGLLLLRGPQTVNELLTRSQRMHNFEDAEQVYHVLQRLIQRELVMQIPRQSGQREDRYMHLLCGEVDISKLPPARRSETAASAHDDRDELLGRIEELERRMAELEGKLTE